MRIYNRTNKIIFALFISFFSCVFPTKSNAQDLSKKISINLKNVSLIDAINEISIVGKVNFSYNPQIIPADKRISIKAKNKTIKEVLEISFINNGLDYVVVENQIVLKVPKEKTTTETNQNNQPKHTISGYLKDNSTGEILIGATVYAKGTVYGTTSNSYGFYSLTLPENEYDFIFSFIGYKNQLQRIKLTENIKITISLDISNFDMKAVEVVADQQETTIHDQPLSTMKLSVQTMKSLPGFVGDIDIIKSLQAIPGIKAYGDGSTLFYVRGGNSDQNLILIDEAPIYNPSHLFGFFSAIAPDAVKDVVAYKGDFPASYGGRLSSVIDIKTKDGNMKKVGFSGSLGPLTSNITLEGPIIKEKCSFFISGRRSNLNWLLNKTYKRTLDIHFFDFNSKLNFKINDKNRLYLTLYKGSDELSRVIGGTALNTFGISWDNVLGTFRWNHVFNNRLFSNTTLYSSRYNYYLFMSKEQNEYWNSSISSGALKTDFTFYKNPKNTIKFGIQFNKFFSNPGNVNIEDVNTRRYVPVTPKYSSKEFDLYISNEQKPNTKLTLRYGLRLPIWRNLGATTVYKFNVNYQVMDTLQIDKKNVYSKFLIPEPRLSIGYALNKNAELKASYSRTAQFIQLLTNSTSPFTSLEVWVPSGPNIKPQVANQFALGYFRKVFKNKFDFSLEPFYKQFQNQIDYVDHANMLFNPLIEGELRFGKAWSYGIEFMLRKQKGKFSGWLGYTYSRSFKQIIGVNNDKTYSAFYDRPHDICINLSYNNTKHWTFSTNWLFQTGAAISTPVSFYYYNGYSVPVFGDKNNDRLPDYHRMDISITYKLSKPEKRFQHSFIFTIYNAYGRNNPISINFNKILDDNGNFVVPADLSGNSEIIPTAISVAKVIPSITYYFKF